MSDVTVITQTQNQMTTNYDVSKLALGNNTFIKSNYTDSGSGSTFSTRYRNGSCSFNR